MSLTVAEIERQLQKNYPGYEKLQLKSLEDYSFKWFKPINMFLRKGEDGFSSHYRINPTERRPPTGIDNFKNFISFEVDGMSTRPTTIPEAIKNVEMRIEQIDSAFLNAAPRTKEEMIVWRGKKGDYYDVSHSIHTGSPSKRNIDTGYISTAKDIETALKFINDDKKDKSYKKTKKHCCLYRMHIMKGIPYIDMTNLSKYKKYESEILLPRNLTITTIENDDESKKISEELGVKVIDIKVEKKENQFDKTPVGGKRRTKLRTKRRRKSIKRRTLKY
jgi:hypothetical protein